MGRQVKTGKSTQAIRSTRVIKHNGLVKRSSKYQYYSKRERMSKRRMERLLDEKKSWEEQNKDLSDRLQSEQIISSALRKELFHLQRRLHECVIANNTYKVKQAEMVQAMSAVLRENDSIYPHMLAFSESITSNKVRLTNMLNTLPSSEYDCLPRQFRDMGKVSDESVKISGKPMKQRVGPMVRGLLITKPKIMLERLMLPQPQDQEPVNDISHSEENNHLTPIPEEDEQEEELCLSHISKRPKRKLGSTWRVRRQEKLEKKREKQMERGSKSPSAVAYDGDSSDTESNPPDIDHMEPVVRFKDVSRLLQNSSLLKIDTTHNANTNGGGSSASRLPETENHNFKRAPEDPLEGSSWMFTNNQRNSFRSSQNNKRPPSLLYKSDSDDEDDDDDDDRNETMIVTQKDVPNTPSMNGLVIELNKTYTVSSPSHETSFTNSSPQAEPDSTNNIDVQSNNTSFKKSLENISRSSSSSFASTNRSPILTSNSSTELNSKDMTPSSGRLSINTSALTVSLSKVIDFNRSSTNTSYKTNKLRSSFCDSCSPVQSPLELSGKRTRKPKNHLYPGEDDVPVQLKKKECLQQKVLTRKRCSLEKNKCKGLTKGNTRLSEGIASNRVNSKPRGSSCGSAKDIKKSVGGNNAEKDPKPIKRSVTKNKTDARSSLSSGRHVSMGSASKSGKIKREKATHINKKSTKRSLKNSLNFSQTSSNGIQPSFVDPEESVRTKRDKPKISYKEKPVNIKQRRP